MAGKMTSIRKGQIVVRPQGQTTCVYHRQTILDWYCKTCCDAICAKCISTTHSGHVFKPLSEEMPNSKAKIVAFVNESEKDKLGDIQKEINSTNDDLKRHLDRFEALASKVKTQGERLQEELSALVSRTLSQLKHLEEENTKLFITYRTELESKLEALEKQLNFCKESLQTGTPIELFDIASGLQTHTTLPTKPCLATAQFSPSSNPHQPLELALGKIVLTSSDQSQQNRLAAQSKPQVTRSSKEVQTHGGERGDQRGISKFPRGFPRPDTKGGHLVFHKDFGNEGLSDDLNTHLAQLRTKISRAEENALSQPSVLTTWKPPCDITSVCPSSVDGIWTCDNSATVTLLGNQGRVEKQLQNPGNVRDICISPTTHTLWACSHTENSITELECGALTCRFKTTDIPKCICLKKDGHVLIGMKKKIVEYNLGGEMVLTVTTTQHGKPLACTPWRMSQCPVSEKVAVVDLDRVADDGQDLPHIIVMNKNLHLIHRYGRPQHDGRYGSGPFDPCDVAYDTQGQLVVADRTNRCIHLLSGAGNYLRRLHNDIGAAWFVSVDRNGVLWAVFSYGGKQVSRIQYMTEHSA
ncbi:uncharacterized protein LOC117317933 [Pecten maximus]|uniref:uncharacterized protein LOC117317933 n=1 Tax=Pecten maximus TaxID=6579 RepID=UPI001458587D|nr:uncharacterized protein LOC117317933 [Pecten maximus]